MSEPTKTPFEALRARLDADESSRSSLQDREYCSIASKVPGWSRLNHYLFFRSMVEATDIQCVLIVGVYHGRDICFLLDARNKFAEFHHLAIHGVDKFNDTECADWLPTAKGKTWEENQYGPPPTIKAAAENICPHLRRKGEVKLIQQPDEDYLATTENKFDLIYLDSSHDYETVARQLVQVRRLCAGASTIIAGDDFNDEGTFGVKKAVTEAFGAVATLGGLIWFTDAAHFVPAIKW